MPALHCEPEAVSKLQSVSIKWIANETDRQGLVDDLISRTEFSETWPFMDWVEEAAADKNTRILGASNSDVGLWAGFIAYRAEFEIKPERPGKAWIDAEISIESLYVTEQERGNRIASTLMQLAMNSVNASIEAIRTQNLLLKMDVRIGFIADCFSEHVQKITTQGLDRLVALQSGEVKVRNQITLFDDDE